MPNTFVVPDWVSKEALRLLVNKLVVAQFFNTDDNDQYKQDFAVGATIRKKLPQR